MQGNRAVLACFRENPALRKVGEAGTYMYVCVKSRVMYLVERRHGPNKITQHAEYPSDLATSDISKESLCLPSYYKYLRGCPG